MSDLPYFFATESTGVTQVSPTTFDAIVLTGYSINSASVPTVLSGFVSTIANLGNSSKYPASQFPNSYLVTGSPQIGDRQNFWYGGGYDEAVFQAAEAAKQVSGECCARLGIEADPDLLGQTFTIGELREYRH